MTGKSAPIPTACCLTICCYLCEVSHRVSPVLPSWILPKPSAVIFYVAREDQPAVRRFHCTAEEKGAFPAASTPRSRGRAGISRTNSGASAASASRPNSSATTASSFSSTGPPGQEAGDTKDKSGPLRLQPFYCEACGDPVAYSFGSPEIFAGVAQGCYPSRMQLREAGRSVDYVADRRRLSRRCHAYFSQLPHSDVSEAIFEALQNAGVLTNSGELADDRRSRSVQKDALLSLEWSNPVLGSGRKRVHPWPISGAPRLPTSSARIKGMASGGNFVSSSLCGIGVEDKTGNVSQYIMNPSDLTNEDYSDNFEAIKVSPTKKISQRGQHGFDGRISLSTAPNFKLSPYGAVLSRRPLTSQFSARRVPCHYSGMRAGDMPAAWLSSGRQLASAPTGGRSRPGDTVILHVENSQKEGQRSDSPRHLAGGTQSLPACDLLRSSSPGGRSTAAVVFDDGSAPRTEVPDRISEQTLHALRASKSKGAGTSLASEQSVGSMGLIQEESFAESTYTPFSECMQKAKALLEHGAKFAGKRVGANGQIVDEDELNQCKIAEPRRQLHAQALMSAHHETDHLQQGKCEMANLEFISCVRSTSSWRFGLRCILPSDASCICPGGRTPSTSSQSSVPASSSGPSRIPSAFSASVGKGLSVMTAGDREILELSLLHVHASFIFCLTA